MRLFPEDSSIHRVEYKNAYTVENGIGTLTGCGHGYCLDHGNGYGRGMTNYPFQLIQYWSSD